MAQAVEHLPTKPLSSNPNTISPRPKKCKPSNILHSVCLIKMAYHELLGNNI
jgi:hypothetical protein